MKPKIKIFAFFAVLAVLACQRPYSLDDFLFEPVKLNGEYLDADDLFHDYGCVNIVPDSQLQFITLTSSNENKIYGFFLSAGPDSLTPVGITILYCHGNSTNINRYWKRVEYLWRMGYNVFIFDYQGYGKSEGSPSGQALYDDGKAALDYVKSRTDTIVYYGWSLGSYVATHLAADIEHPKALILESAPASVEALLRDAGLVDLPGDYVAQADFDNVKRISEIGCPLFMMHGRADDYVVFERHFPYIWNAAIEPKDSLSVIGAVHDNVPEILGVRYDQLITDFINRQVRKINP
jgi:pimeloyl-ACP methyl ester carboxylesterase